MYSSPLCVCVSLIASNQYICSHAKNDGVEDSNGLGCQNVGYKDEPNPKSSNMYKKNLEAKIN